MQAAHGLNDLPPEATTASRARDLDWAEAMKHRPFPVSLGEVRRSIPTAQGTAPLFLLCLLAHLFWGHQITHELPESRAKRRDNSTDLQRRREYSTDPHTQLNSKKHLFPDAGVEKDP